MNPWFPDLARFREKPNGSFEARTPLITQEFLDLMKIPHDSLATYKFLTMDQSDTYDFLSEKKPWLNNPGPDLGPEVLN